MLTWNTHLKHFMLKKLISYQLMVLIYLLQYIRLIFKTIKMKMAVSDFHLKTANEKQSIYDIF